MQDAAKAVVPAAKAVVILDHLKNNRMEYLILVAIGTVLGWTQEAMSYAQGLCAASFPWGSWLF